jgi:hypothetical protein
MAITVAYTQDQEYPFSLLRQGRLHNAPIGLVSNGDMYVSPASGLQVSIGAGEIYIPQTITRQALPFYAQRALYYCANDSAANPYNTITAPIAFPRVDQIILRVYDAYEQQLSGNSYARYEWLPGTETSGATLTNKSGASALPANSITLSYNLATVGMSSWSAANIWQTWVPGVATNAIMIPAIGPAMSGTITRSSVTSYQPNPYRPTVVQVGTAGNNAYMGAAVAVGGQVAIAAGVALPVGASFQVPASWYYYFTGSANVTEQTL